MKVELYNFKKGILRTLPVGLKGDDETPIKKLSDTFSDILYPIYERSYSLEDYYRGESRDEYTYITGQVIYDIDLEVNYVLYKTILPPIFNSEFILTDGYDLFGIDKIQLDQEETDKNGQFYYFRIYVGKRVPIGEDFYVMRDSLSLSLSTNDGITLSAFNSKRVNESLKRNIKHFVANRNSLETLTQIGKSLEATVNVSPLSVVSDEVAQILINKDIKGIVVTQIENGDYLFSGSIYSLSFDDYRLDLVSSEKSFVAVSEREKLLDINKDMVLHNVVPPLSLPEEWVIDGDLLKYRCQIELIDDFYARIGKTDNWILEIMGGLSVFKLVNIYQSFDSGESEYTFQYSSGTPILELSDWINNMVIKYNFRQNRSSRRTRYCIFKLLSETDSSEKKMMLNVYQYNFDLLKKFLSDRIEIIGVVAGYTGSGHLFKGTGQYEIY